jgi:hypothetical protein
MSNPAYSLPSLTDEFGRARRSYLVYRRGKDVMNGKSRNRTNRAGVA